MATQGSTSRNLKLTAKGKRAAESFRARQVLLSLNAQVMAHVPTKVEMVRK